MTKFKVGDRVRVIGNTVIEHHFDIGEEVEIENVIDTTRYGTRAVTGSRNHFQIVYVDDLELIEECDTMAHNNGDLIKAQVSRDDYGAPVYNLFVKFGEFYYNLSSPKQMRGAKSLPRGNRRIVGTMSGTGDHMLAAIEGKSSDTTEDSRPKDPEVSKVGAPFDSEPAPKSIRIPKPDGSEEIFWIDDGDSEQWEKDNAETLKALRAFQDACDSSGFITTNKLSDEELVKKDGYNLMKY